MEMSYKGWVIAIITSIIITKDIMIVSILVLIVEILILDRNIILININKTIKTYLNNLNLVKY